MNPKKVFFVELTSHLSNLNVYVAAGWKLDQYVPENVQLACCLSNSVVQYETMSWFSLGQILWFVYSGMCCCLTQNSLCIT